MCSVEKLNIAAQVPSYQNGRFGFGVAGGDPTVYDVELLNAGWYWDWSARQNASLSVLDYVRTIRLSPTKTGYSASPTGTALLNVVAANPGTAWFIGNEPDCIWQDNLRSEVYADAYHDLYMLIKNADPTAKIGVGSIVQPTPQRMRYLDRVLAAYEARYGAKLPTDLWVIHSYILCETCMMENHPGAPWPWGACPVPDWPDPTDPPEDAVYYALSDHWSLDIFQQRIRDFRYWMREHGYQDRPLVVSEYGILFWYPFVQEFDGEVIRKTEEDAIEFMQGTFDYMRTARDQRSGFFADDHRLVQRWAWYSLNHDADYMGGALFDQEGRDPFPLGQAYAAYTSRITPTVDLRLKLSYETLSQEKQSQTDLRLISDISNAGNIGTGLSLTTTFLANGEVLTTTSVPPLTGWGEWHRVEVTLTDLLTGTHPFCVRVETSSVATENCAVAFVNPERVFLPLVSTNGRGD